MYPSACAPLPPSGHHLGWPSPPRPRQHLKSRRSLVISSERVSKEENVGIPYLESDAYDLGKHGLHSASGILPTSCITGDGLCQEEETPEACP